MAALNLDACEFKPIQVVASPFSRLCNAPKPIPPSFSFTPTHYFPTFAMLSLLRRSFPCILTVTTISTSTSLLPGRTQVAKLHSTVIMKIFAIHIKNLFLSRPSLRLHFPIKGKGKRQKQGGETEGVIPTFRNYSRIGFLYRRRRGRRTGEGHAKTWVRKIASDEVIESGDCAKTTLMIRNIPVKYTIEMLLQFLDDHCLQENKKLSKDGGVDHLDSASAYDFVYLPMDFSCGRNKGYAFVNLTNSSGADRLRRFLHGYRWGILSSNKVCEITDARIQGRKALEIQFEGSIFVCQMQSYLPTVFEPYRNGLCSFISRKVGRFLHRRRRN